MDLGVMAMEYSILTKSPDLVCQHQMQFCVIPKMLLFGGVADVGGGLKPSARNTVIVFQGPLTGRIALFVVIHLYDYPTFINIYFVLFGFLFYHSYDKIILTETILSEDLLYLGFDFCVA